MGLNLALRPLSNAGARQVEDLRSQLHIQSISRILPISNTPAAVHLLFCYNDTDAIFFLNKYKPNRNQIHLQTDNLKLHLMACKDKIGF